MTTDHASPRRIISRRALLKLFSASLLSQNLIACSHKKFLNPDEDILLSGGNKMDDDRSQNVLVVINLIQKEKRLIETPFLPHGIHINPANKYQLFCFEKNGKNACEIDLQTRRITRLLQAGENQLFSGHASFSHDGKNIYCVESDSQHHQGSISIRNTQTFEVTQRLPTPGLSPHDSQLDKDNILTVSNTGRSKSGFHQPSLVRIDMDTGKLIERIKLEHNNQTFGQLNCGHFRMGSDDDLVIASAPVDSKDKTLPGGVSIRNHDGSLTTMDEPEVVIKRMTGEALGIEINQQQSIVAITHPEANLITFWSIKHKKIIKAFGIEKPRGLSQTLDQEYFIVSYGESPAMATISTKDLQPQADSIVQPTLTSGEHMINWSKQLRHIMPAHIYD
ncbi:MAG: DUF1513 domain-containing protein [Gammaproteobacteria bacterium]|nr:DUF1513 domain-containing protein [Gammaproteobacteria bacterium]